MEVVAVAGMEVAVAVAVAGMEVAAAVRMEVAVVAGMEVVAVVVAKPGDKPIRTRLRYPRHRRRLHLRLLLL